MSGPAERSIGVVAERRVTFGRPLIEPQSIEEAADSLRTGWIGTGPKVARFERMLEEYLAVASVCCVSSATAGLSLVLRALGVGPGDEVLLPAMTFVGCAQAVEFVGATPVAVDSEPRTDLISLELAAQRITPRSRAVLVVHLAGRPMDMAELERFCAEHGLIVVEDAAHAIGAAIDGRRIGAWGNPAVFSFGPGKNITSIEGGAVATDDPVLAERVRKMALHGLDSTAWERFSDHHRTHYDAGVEGFKFSMPDVHAAVALHQLPRLEEWIDLRERQWDLYDEALADLPVDLPPPAPAGTRHGRHLYRLSVADASPVSRDELAARLAAAGVGSGIHYRALHLHSHYRKRYALEPDDLPVATEASRRVLSLPIGPSVSDADQAHVIATIRSILTGDAP
jgi:dTDP-4-amino-4,6-dideoxygalactose transaminase